MISKEITERLECIAKEITCKKNMKQEVEHRLAMIDKYPGPLSEYDSITEKRHEIIRIPPNFIIDLSRIFSGRHSYGDEEIKLFQSLFDAGLTAVIHYSPIHGYGVPVRKID